MYASTKMLQINLIHTSTNIINNWKLINLSTLKSIQTATRFNPKS